LNPLLVVDGFIFTVGFACGYAVRAYISRQRRERLRAAQHSRGLSRTKTPAASPDPTAGQQ